MLSLIALSLLAAPHSSATLVSSVSVAQPGKPFLAAVRMKMEPGWHAYWLNPGDSGMPTTVDWNLHKGWTAGHILWPTPHRIEMGGLVNYGYENEALLLVRITPGATPQQATLAGTAKWLICREGCIPAEESLSLPISVGAAEQANPIWTSRLTQAETKLPRSLPDYTFSASRRGSAITLIVKGPQAQQNATFFPADETIEASAPQKSTIKDGNLNLTLKVSQYAPAKTGRLKGLLVAPPGRPWKTGIDALVVDTDITAIGG